MTSIRPHAVREPRMVQPITAFWTTFWVLNGLDKFFNGAVWFGVSRDPSIVAHLERFQMPVAWAHPTLYCIGAWELGLGVAFGWSLVSKDRRGALLPLAFHASIGLFTFFGECDFVDRAQPTQPFGDHHHRVEPFYRIAPVLEVA